MAKREKSFEFVGRVAAIDYGRMVYWAIFLPAAIASTPAFAGKKPVRMRGRFGGEGGRDVALAWQRKGGRWYVLVSKATARAIGAKLGSRVEVAFELVAGDDVEVPAEIGEAIDQEPEWAALWKNLTPGAQRGAAHWVASAKGEMIRADRAVRIFTALEAGLPPIPTKRPRPG